jgi:hypothetical protein
MPLSHLTRPGLLMEGPLGWVAEDAGQLSAAEDREGPWRLPHAKSGFKKISNLLSLVKIRGIKRNFFGMYNAKLLRISGCKLLFSISYANYQMGLLEGRKANGIGSEEAYRGSASAILHLESKALHLDLQRLTMALISSQTTIKNILFESIAKYDSIDKVPGIDK